MNTKPLEQEDITNLDLLKQRQKAVQDEILAIGLSKLNIEDREEQVKTVHKENKQIELQLGKQLQEKYGEGAIDLEKKVFIPAVKEN